MSSNRLIKSLNATEFFVLKTFALDSDPFLVVKLSKKQIEIKHCRLDHYIPVLG